MWSIAKGLPRSLSYWKFGQIKKCMTQCKYCFCRTTTAIFNRHLYHYNVYIMCVSDKDTVCVCVCVCVCVLVGLLDGGGDLPHPPKDVSGYRPQKCERLNHVSRGASLDGGRGGGGLGPRVCSVWVLESLEKAPYKLNVLLWSPLFPEGLSSRLLRLMRGGGRLEWVPWGEQMGTNRKKWQNL